MTPRIWILLVLVVLALGAGGLVTTQFRADLAQARSALRSIDVRMAQTPFGPVTFADQGRGFPVLSIHGTGGGYDQGLAMAAGLQAAGYRIVAPSRFGYPGSPDGSRNDAIAQADAFAAVLDHLRVERAVVMGASAGAITALAFAARHPSRTAALLLMVPAYYPAGQQAPEPWSPFRTWAITTALRSNFLYWAGRRLAPDAVAATILATDRRLIGSADAAERARLDAVLDMILPISARADGLILDAYNTASPPSIDLTAVRAPTFIASAEDDQYRTADSARLLARGIDGARLLITPDGGHVWVNRSGQVEAAAAAFLSEVLEGSGS